ncbi:hypothetical protein BCR34DRAFT_592555 [Clohesyomyces aquaticus]|uniref:RING-type domain-containing protein n=1 Tax=Clohesyomyces aquaticus TaxID=1231657 RepID=A0A1Y1YQZ7_9PLEO|nr:hypothetical protein BCR34DRAFT_592555 [Clohesyomyces aquaticus]
MSGSPSPTPSLTLTTFLSEHCTIIPPSSPRPINPANLCALCAEDTDLRVNLPTCNHRLCTDCLAYLVMNPDKQSTTRMWSIEALKKLEEKSREFREVIERGEKKRAEKGGENVWEEADGAVWDERPGF